MYTTQTCFFATCVSKGKYVLKARDTGNYLDVNSSNALTQTSTQSFATVFNFDGIETESFNNFWSGGYSRGIYNGVAHIKIELDSSITNSERYKNNDFSSALLWNDITERVVIYGPEDEVPDGITPFVVTFKTANLPVEYENMITVTGFVAGATVPNGLTRDDFHNLTTAQQQSLLTSNWDSVTIYLTTSSDAYSGYSSTQTEQLIDATIAHEMGHALKLKHPYDNTAVHDFLQSHGTFASKTVYSVMNQGNAFNASNLAAAVPQALDIVNLLSKWEHHLNCNH